MDAACRLNDLCVVKANKDRKNYDMSIYNIHKAASRGRADHGWLTSYQSFSFAGYFNPERVNFGALRVLNDDTVAGGKGFGLHPHDNMEIISIPLSGALEHKDNIGNSRVIREGEVQVMSTGTGVFHSEYNYNADAAAQFLQIWVFPRQLNVAPRYDQIRLDRTRMQNRLMSFIAPEPREGSTWLHQDAWFSLGVFDAGHEATYQLNKSGHGVYAFVISGSFTIDGHRLEARDALAIEDAAVVKVLAESDKAELLVMEVPMLP